MVSLLNIMLIISKLLSMKEIQLTRGKVAFVSDSDYELVTNHKWCYDPPTKRGSGYAAATIKQKKVYLHRFIMNPATGEYIDHINHNGLDCRRENLRICNNGQNTVNGRTRPSKSGFKGVAPARNGKWSTYITKDYKTKWLGYSDSKHNAAAVYDLAAFEIHGEFTKPNLACSKILFEAKQLEKSK